MTKYAAWAAANDQWRTIGRPNLVIRRTSVIDRFVIEIWNKGVMVFHGRGSSWESALDATTAACARWQAAQEPRREIL